MSILLIVNNKNARRTTERLELLEENGIPVELVVFSANSFINFIKYFISTLITTIRVVKQKNIKVISTMNNPFYLHLFGLFLKILFPKLRWFVEFREGWVCNVERMGQSRLKKYIHKILEQSVISKADIVGWIENSIADADYFKKEYALQAYKIFKLPCGCYDPAKFRSSRPIRFSKFTIVYAGTFYDNWIEPLSFLRGFARFIKEAKLSSEDVQVLFYGDWRKKYWKIVDDLKIRDYVKVFPRISYNKIIRILKGADILLHIVGTRRENKDQLSLKFFDYIGARKPILVLGYEDHLACKIVTKYNLGIYANIDDPCEISKAIEKIYKKDFIYNPPNIVYAIYSDRSFKRSILECYRKLLK